MRIVTIALALLCASAGTSVPADAADRPLAPLDFLIGHCWRGPFADGKSIDTHCFESVYGGQFVRDRHVVRGDKPDYQGESIYWVDGRTHGIRYMYFNSDGGVSNGTMQPQGERLQFGDEVYTGSDGKTQRFRTVWQKKGADGYVATTEQRNGDAWVEAWRVEFTRVAK